MSYTRFVLAPLVALSVSASLLGCAPEPGSTPSPQPEKPAVAPEESATSKPTPAPEPEPKPAATVLPSCEEIIPASELTSFHEAFQQFDSSNAASKMEMMLGPMGWAALSGSDPTVMCSWGIPMSDGGSSLGVGVIDEATKTELVAALRESVYTEVTVPGADFAFEQGISAEHRWSDKIVFDGDVMIAVVHTITGDFADRAHRRVSELNPGLGES